KYSVLPALDSNGIFALEIFKGSVNTEKFIAFLCEQVAPKLNPYPHSRSVVVMDNCRIHHDDEIRQIIEEECSGYISLPGV
ncbi:hypothetical protein BV22DRAFT_987860, partial [Leucogyrophana mollusca]